MSDQKKPTNLPQTPGHYLWWVLDWGYLGVGAVTVSADSEEHRKYLKGQRELSLSKGEKPYFSVYQTEGGQWLSMYTEDHTTDLFDGDGNPWADGYRLFTFDWLEGKTENPTETLPLKFLTPKGLAEMLGVEGEVNCE